VKKDLALSQLKAAIEDLGNRARAAGAGSVSFLYFAGHGLSDGAGRNFILPVDISSLGLQNLAVHGLDAQWIIDRLRTIAPDSDHIVVLDACRSELKLGEGSAKAGFAIRNALELPAGMLLAYSTDDGQAAPDSTVYAERLKGVIVLANVPVSQAFAALSLQVSDTSAGRRPWYIGDLRHKVNLGFTLDGGEAAKLPLAATDKTQIVFLDRTKAYKTPNTSGGIVEIRAQGSVVMAKRPDQIFLTQGQGRDGWVTYPSFWGRVYVQKTDAVQLN
jgi:uncharacterized caspase-like protein